MIVGMLVALTMVFLFASHLDTLTLARAVAIGFGGSINRGLRFVNRGMIPPWSFIPRLKLVG